MAITIDGTTGITTPGLVNTGTESVVGLTTTGNTILGDASTDTLNVGNGGLVKDASGNVGIGTSSPAYRLDIQGNAAGQFWASIKNTNAGASSIGGWFFGNDTYSDVGGVFAGSSGGGGFGGANSMNIGSWKSAPLAMFTNNTERMRINSSGNIGVNTGANIYNTFHVNGGISVQSGPVYATSGAGLELWYNTALGVGEVVAYDRTNSVYKKLDISGTVVTATTEGVERLRIDSSGTLILNQGQIKFPSTQVASANANTLDDYEEGSWTPTVTSSSGAITSYTAFGYYTKIGRIVSAQFHISMTNIGTAAGTYLNVASIPFTGNAGMTFQGTYRENAVNGFMGQVSLGTSQFSLLRYDNSGVAVAGGVYIGNITYHV